MARRMIDLNGSGWEFGSIEQQPFGDVNDMEQVQEWLPAQVPGDVRLDLLRAGKIADPFWGENNGDSQWVDARDWWYRTSVRLELEPGERAFLVLEGVDYQSAVFVDGTQLGRHVGMFSRQVYELPHAAGNASRTRQIAVRIWGSDALPKMQLSPLHAIWKRAITPLFPSASAPFADRYATLKCQMQFGWDFAPRLLTSGIWDDVSIVVVRSVLIRDVWLRTRSVDREANTAQVRAVLTLDADAAQVVRLVVHARGWNFEAPEQTFTSELELDAGEQTPEFAVTLQDVRLWNPWDRGEPNLYEIEFSVESAQAQPLDMCSMRFGVRTLELVPPEGAARDAEPWTFVINGGREFIRGVNWVPMDAIPGRMRREDYKLRLGQARMANVNFLRVWGGGLKEKQAFYDLCDEMGILVWQEFPFAGAVLDRFPTNAGFLDLVKAEAGAVVRALRNHPSLAVWCGGNEFNTRGNASIVKALQAVVEQQDGTRPFKPASPFRDEEHYWRVWHRKANLRDYQKTKTPFLSEFGLQAPPDVESLKKFLPEDKLYPPNEMWVYHRAELDKLERYARSVNPQLDSLEDFAGAAQKAQAIGVQIAVEHMRRRKGRTSGVAVWQLDDPWPAISWSLIDYYGKLKSAYTVLKALYVPAFASLDYALRAYHAGETVSGDLWLINDLLRALNHVQVRASLDGVTQYEREFSLAPDSAERVDHLQVRLGEGKNILHLEMRVGEQTLCDHTYDLGWSDTGEIKPWVALAYSLYDRLMR